VTGTYKKNVGYRHLEVAVAESKPTISTFKTKQKLQMFVCRNTKPADDPMDKRASPPTSSSFSRAKLTLVWILDSQPKKP
jgi:hypothetical protein